MLPYEAWFPHRGKGKKMKKNILVLLSVLIILLAFVACDGNKLTVSNEVRFFTGIRKAAADSIWALNDEIGIWMLDTSGKTYDAIPERYNKRYKADTSGSISGFIPYYADASNILRWNDLVNDADKKFDFIAYYPYRTDDQIFTVSGTTAYLKLDVSATNAPQDSGKADVLWGRVDGIENGASSVSFNLSHKLARLIVYVKESVTVKETDLVDDFSIEINGLHTTAQFWLENGQIWFPTGADKKIIMKDISDTLTQEEKDAGKVRKFEAIVMPEAHSDALLNRFSLTFTNTPDIFTWEAKELLSAQRPNVKFESGKQHIYNIRLDAYAPITVIDITVEDWILVNGGDAVAIVD